MTQIAVLHGPGNLAIVASAAVFATNNGEHVDIATARLEWKAYVAMAGLAGKTHAVKPVWKNNRPNPILIRGIIEHDIAIFCVCL